MKKPDWQDLLGEKIKNSQKITVLGIGSELRGDDVAGVRVAQKLIDQCSQDCQKDILNSRLQVLFGYTAPENFTDEIRKFSPSHIIMIDSAEMGEEPGTAKFIAPQEIQGTTFSTHSLPLSVLVDYLHQSLPCEILVIGIEPKQMDFGSKISREVRKTVNLLSDSLIAFAKTMG